MRRSQDGLTPLRCVLGIFIIEGSVTCVVALFALWQLPNGVAKAPFLTEEQKHFARASLLLPLSSSLTEGFGSQCKDFRKTTSRL